MCFVQYPSPCPLQHLEPSSNVRQGLWTAVTQTKVAGSVLFPFHQLRLLKAPGHRLESWSCSTADSDEEHEQTPEEQLFVVNRDRRDFFFLIKSQGWAFECKCGGEQ